MNTGRTSNACGTRSRHGANDELAKAIAISRKQFENGECLTEEESFKEIENMLDEMATNGE